MSLYCLSNIFWSRKYLLLFIMSFLFSSSVYADVFLTKIGSWGCWRVKKISSASPTRSCSRQGWALQLQTQCAWAWARGHAKVEGFSLLMVGIMILLGLQVIGCTYNVTPCKLPSIKTICWTHMLSFQLSILIAAVEGASMLLKLGAIMLLDVRGKGAAFVNSLFKHFSTYCYMFHCPAQM